MGFRLAAVSTQPTDPVLRRGAALVGQSAAGGSTGQLEKQNGVPACRVRERKPQIPGTIPTLSLCM